jgi:hypothetical protein
MSRVVLLAALALAGSGALTAATLTIDVQAQIDGMSLLVFQGDTVQWHNLTWGAPSGPTIFTTTLDGVTQWTDYEWDPVWAWPYSWDLWSSALSPFVPALPNGDMTVELEVIQARDDGFLTISQYPEAANGYTLILNFDDGLPGGNAWYRGLLTIQYEDSGIPEPSTFLLAGLAQLGGLALLRRRARASSR